MLIFEYAGFVSKAWGIVKAAQDIGAKIAAGKQARVRLEEQAERVRLEEQAERVRLEEQAERVRLEEQAERVRLEEQAEREESDDKSKGAQLKRDFFAYTAQLGAERSQQVLDLLWREAREVAVELAEWVDAREVKQQLAQWRDAREIMQHLEKWANPRSARWRSPLWQGEPEIAAELAQWRQLWAVAWELAQNRGVSEIVWEMAGWPDEWEVRQQLARRSESALNELLLAVDISYYKNPCSVLPESADRIIADYLSRYGGRCAQRSVFDAILSTMPVRWAGEERVDLPSLKGTMGLAIHIDDYSAVGELINVLVGYIELGGRISGFGLSDLFAYRRGRPGVLLSLLKRVPRLLPHQGKPEMLVGACRAIIDALHHEQDERAIKLLCDGLAKLLRDKKMRDLGENRAYRSGSSVALLVRALVVARTASPEHQELARGIGQDLPAILGAFDENDHRLKDSNDCAYALAEGFSALIDAFDGDLAKTALELSFERVLPYFREYRTFLNVGRIDHLYGPISAKLVPTETPAALSSLDLCRLPGPRKPPSWTLSRKGVIRPDKYDDYMDSGFGVYGPPSDSGFPRGWEPAVTPSIVGESEYDCGWPCAHFSAPLDGTEPLDIDEVLSALHDLGGTGLK